MSSVYGLAGMADNEKTLIILDPTISSIRPNSGSVKGGNLLTITGLGFGNIINMRVNFEGAHIEKYDDYLISSTSDTLILKVKY